MSGRPFFSHAEKICLQELILKYHLNSNTTLAAKNPAVKKMIWANLTEEFNSIETNSKRTEAQLRKCWDNLKTRKKAALCKEMTEGIKTEGRSHSPDLLGMESSSQEVYIEEELDQVDSKMQFDIDIDYDPLNDNGNAVSDSVECSTPIVRQNQQGPNNGRAKMTLLERRLRQEEELHRLKIQEQKLKNLKEKILLKKARLEVEAAEQALQSAKIKKTLLNIVMNDIA